MATKISVYRMSLDRSPAETAECRRLLAPDELRRADAFRDPAHGHRFVVCRAMLRRQLGELLGEAPATICFHYAANGKPELADSSSNLHFNVSHARGHAILAIRRGAPVGVDIEAIRPEMATNEIARRFFSPREIEELNNLSVEQRTLAFFRCWTRKEAFVKATGLGLGFPLDQFDVSTQPEVARPLLAIRGNSAQAAQWTLRDVAVWEGFVAAVAGEGCVDDVEIDGPSIA